MNQYLLSQLIEMYLLETTLIFFSNVCHHDIYTLGKLEGKELEFSS